MIDRARPPPLPRRPKADAWEGRARAADARKPRADRHSKRELPRAAEHDEHVGEHARGWAALLLPLLLFPACGSDNAATSADGDGGADVTTDTPNLPDGNLPDTSTTDGGGDDGAADAPPDTAPPGCDTAKDPKDSPPCVDDKFGLFVDASKPTGGTGTKASPFKTIGAAIAATGTLKRIYVCAGSYAEKVSLDAAHDGVSI